MWGWEGRVKMPINSTLKFTAQCHGTKPQVGDRKKRQFGVWLRESGQRSGFE
jgi:hypothetical protein